MNKEYTCILCPNSCEIEIVLQGNVIVHAEGNLCDKGMQYVQDEIKNPTRTISTSIPVDGGELPLVSVRLTHPIPKERIFDIMDIIKCQRLNAPVVCGQLILENVMGLGSNVIATKTVLACKQQKGGS